MADEDERFEIESVSLCLACAKHAEVKALVASDVAPGVCGICAVSGPVFNPAKFGELRGLIRALIRFNYDEEVYNGHWGGSSVQALLLKEENLIIEKAMSDEYSDEFMHRIEWEGEVYPEPEDGIWLYAGSDDTGRGLQYSIRRTNSVWLSDIRSRLERHNFHSVEPEIEKFVAAIEADIASEIPEGALWYRSRIGVVESALHVGRDDIVRIATPYVDEQIGALPPPRATAGRTNREGVSVLYLADEIDTALAEIRPHPGHLISVGGFRADRLLRVASFDVPISRFSGSDRLLSLFAEIFHLDALLGAPVVPEERYRYAATQLLADILIRHGFDGITFRSSVGSGRNLCVFDPSLFTFDRAHSYVRRVDALRYQFSEVLTEIPTGAW